jgi:hypothetical protein
VPVLGNFLMPTNLKKVLFLYKKAQIVQSTQGFIIIAAQRLFLFSIKFGSKSCRLEGFRTNIVSSKSFSFAPLLFYLSENILLAKEAEISGVEWTYPIFCLKPIKVKTSFLTPSSINYSSSQNLSNSYHHLKQIKR